MNVLRSFQGWLALTVTILLWALALYGLWTVEQQKSNYAVLVGNAEKETQLVAQSSRLHGLLNDTKDGRAALNGIISSDVIGLVDAVDAVGKTAGVDLQISNVQPEPPKKGAPVGAAVPVLFSFQTEGTFAQMARIVQLLNALPIPSTIQQLDFSQAGSTWRLSGRVRVLTASEISS